jgi:hypothetical protein
LPENGKTLRLGNLFCPLIIAFLINGSSFMSKTLPERQHVYRSGSHVIQNSTVTPLRAPSTTDYGIAVFPACSAWIATGCFSSSFNRIHVNVFQIGNGSFPESKLSFFFGFHGYNPPFFILDTVRIDLVVKKKNSIHFFRSFISK